MTNCMIVREELLDAAPDELAGFASTAVATHVRTCPRCGPLARMILDEQTRLATALSLVQPGMSAEAAASEVLASRLAIQDLRIAPEPETRRERFVRLVTSAFPMAAAAALAAYLVYGDRSPVPYSAQVTEQPATAVTITAAPGTGTVILNTADPDITFAWFGKEIAP